MIKIALNKAIPSNSAFFDPISRVHLTLANPMGTAEDLTPSIFRGIKAGTLLDIDHVVDITKNTIEEATASVITTALNENNATAASTSKKSNKKTVTTE